MKELIIRDRQSRQAGWPTAQNSVVPLSEVATVHKTHLCTKTHPGICLGFVALGFQRNKGETRTNAPAHPCFDFQLGKVRRTRNSTVQETKRFRFLQLNGIPASQSPTNSTQRPNHTHPGLVSNCGETNQRDNANSQAVFDLSTTGENNVNSLTLQPAQVHGFVGCSIGGTHESGGESEHTDGRLRRLRHVEQVVEQRLVPVRREQVELVQHEQNRLALLPACNEEAGLWARAHTERRLACLD